MALCSPQLQKFLSNKICGGNYGCNKSSKKSNIIVKGGEGRRLCSAIAIDAPASIASVSGIRWGSVKLQGAREEMEDDAVIIQSDELHGFSYAAVFDGHAGFSSVRFLREELYRECVAALQGGKLLSGKDLKAVEKALQDAFESVDAKLLKWLEESGGEDESGATATATFIREDMLFISHVGDSCVALSRSGKAEVLTDSHRPYGNKQSSLQEIRRIREAGGWIVNGRICGDISVSRAFGDIRFKTKKNEMVKKGVKEGRWSEKFASRLVLTGDFVTASPDVYQVALGADAEFVVLASDGLWDYMSSSDAISFIRNQLRKHGDVQMASEALAQMSLDRGSQDNISIIIADLRRTDWQNLPLQKENVGLELVQAVATVSLVSLGIWMSTLLSS
ncbi:thylakoid-associated phosphatase 38 [Perilla frutescens var. hirtella]|uniref:protein-serine/threonine phosphatase n=1 Tax=Perilla frutescens var. hirtella TaxID=608512 RepID=A0AAD4J6J2_PERFH|nr:thylakoid-associated phosphatase 38 [Perilla frutescens var. hirtella]